MGDKMEKKKFITDANGKEISKGNRVRYATWGMFDVWVKDKENSGRKDDDPKYVTHVKIGTVEKLLNEEDGSMHIKPDGFNGVIHMCTKPSWGARPEFIEVINQEVIRKIEQISLEED